MFSRSRPDAPERPTPVLEDEAPPPAGRLSTFYGEALALALQLQAAAEFGDSDVLRERTTRLLKRAEREAHEAGVERDATRQATFAVVALLDETVRASGWSGRERWSAAPLQLEMFDRNDAGEEFFVRLDALREAPAEHADLLELYYLCLSLGFKGRYEFLPPAEHRELVRGVYRDLRRVPGMGEGPLAPHAEPAGRVAATVRRRVPPWAVLAVCGALAVIAYTSLAVYSRATAASAVTAIESEIAEAVATGPDAAAFGAEVDDPLAEASAADSSSAAAPPEPIDGFPRSDALPAPPPDPEAEVDPADGEAADGADGVPPGEPTDAP